MTRLAILLFLLPSVAFGQAASGLPSNTFISANFYGALADGATDNSTAITKMFAASNAITSGIPTVYFPCQPGKQCQYNFGGTGTSPINPTIATTILCDQGVNLHYTGSAHMMDIGATGLVQATAYTFPFRITGCTITDTGSATHDIYVNQYNTMVEIDHNYFRDTPASASSTAFAVYLAGDNWDSNVHDNRFIVDNNTASNFLRVISLVAEPLDTQLRIHDNQVVCWANVHGSSVCSGTSGIGIWVDGWGSSVQGNNLAFMQPPLRIGPNSPFTRVVNNYFETSPTSSVPAIQFGDPGDGTNTYNDGLIIADNSFDTQNSSTTSFLGPTTANDLLTNTSIINLHGLNVSASSVLVTQNNTAGQTGNLIQHPCFTVNTTLPCSLAFNIHTTGLNILPWVYLDQGTYSDSFPGSSLATVWQQPTGTNITSFTVSGNLLSCAIASNTCLGYYTYDVAGNQTATITINTVPTGTDQIGVVNRAQVQLAGNTGFSMYQCAYVSGTGIQMYKVVGGLYAQLGGNFTATTPSPGDQLIFTSIGNLHNCYLQHSTGLIPAVVNQVDSTYTTGYGGILLFGTTGRLTNFSVQSFQ